ncbi:MAG: cobalamin-5-phosphate synthase CobS [Variovorax sp.]|nr:cobalamin-5-phosphate synthase CobS [Variovorax sp.]
MGLPAEYTQGTMNGIRHFLLALQFFTRLPVTGRLAQWVGFSPRMLRASAAHFPGVGWLVGGVGAAVFTLAQAGLPGAAGALAAALLSTVATALFTGAFHEDGLADMADGLGGSADRARALEIMKDSRIGAFGAIALALALGLKVALLATLAGQGAAAVASAIVGAHVLSRLAPLFLIRGLPYVGDSGASKAKPLADAIGGGALAVGVAWSIPALVPVALAQGAIKTIAMVLACTLAAGWMARLLWRRLGGFTGDGLGATQQVCELAIYLALAWRA